MSIVQYDAGFAARIDPGPDMMRWPLDIRNAVTNAVIQIRQRNPRLGRILEVASRVDDKSEIIGFPYRVIVTLIIEEDTLQ